MDRQNAPGHPMIVFPMTPVAESIPTTVSTEIAVTALRIHHRRRRPEPRTIHPTVMGLTNAELWLQPV